MRFEAKIAWIFVYLPIAVTAADPALTSACLIVVGECVSDLVDGKIDLPSIEKRKHNVTAANYTQSKTE